jgi:hypothetical protein
MVVVLMPNIRRLYVLISGLTAFPKKFDAFFMRF